MDRILHLHWDRFVSQLLDLPIHPDQEEWELAQQAKALLEMLENQGFQADEILDLDDEIFTYAFAILEGSPSPVAQLTAASMDEDAEQDKLTLFNKLHAVPDPFVAEGFV